MRPYDINNSPGGFLEPQSVTDAKNHQVRPGNGECGQQPWVLTAVQKELSEVTDWDLIHLKRIHPAELSVVAFPGFSRDFSS